MRKNKKDKKTILRQIIFDKNFPGFVAASIVLFIAYKFMKVDTLDISLFLSVFTLFVCNILGRLIYNLYSNNKEDSIKLSTDYDGICKRYKEEPLLTYNRNVKFPIIVLVKRKLKDKPFDIIMDHKNAANVYSLPEQIENRSEWLLDAHRCSYDYDSRTVRLDNLTHKDNKVILTYSNTTYWDLLRTNRAMDYEWENRKTNRNVYEPGPFISPLESSLMANHIGFNAFIEFPEIGILFVGRSNKLSVGKKTWGTSVSAKLSPKFDYKKGEHFTLDRFYDSIAESINRELKYFTVNGQSIHLKGNPMYPNELHKWVALDDNSLVSMNMWGLTPEFLDMLEAGFAESFETEVPTNPLKAEFLIPTFIGELLDEKKMMVKVLRTNDTWYGMTYKEGVEAVKESFKGMIEDGVYDRELLGDL